MYQHAVTNVLVATAGVMLADLVLRLARWRKLVAPAVRRRTVPVAASRIAVNAASVIALAVSAWTGFRPLAAGAASLTGAPLLLHVGAAPALAAAAVLAALFWADRNRFTRGDWNRLRRPVGASAPRAANWYATIFRKLTFWIAVALVVPAATSSTLAMFPVLDQAWQGHLLQVHRWSVLPLAASGALCSYFSVVTWLGGQGD